MFKRETIKFMIPRSLLALSYRGVTGIDRTLVPLYINPSSFNITYNKKISDTQTLGGFVIQYWGDGITNISMGGETGSGGIEAINILYNKVYKSEQNQMKEILIKRQQALSEDVNNEINNPQNSTATNAAAAIDQAIFNGGFTSIVSGVGEMMQFYSDALSGNKVNTASSTSLLPTLSAFAVSIQMYFQGKIFVGYIDNMVVNENGNSPGIFSYTISFKSLKEYGERKNFMPWHTNPEDDAGRPIQIPLHLGENRNLSFPFIDARKTVTTTKNETKVIDDQTGTSNEIGDINNISRYNKIK